MLAVKSYQSVINFVSGIGLHDALSVIVGDIHLDAAKMALETSEISKNPKDRINSAITHLEAAHIAYSKVHGELDNFLDLKSFLKKTVDTQYVLNAISKDAWVCSLLSICYLYLEEYKAARKALSLGEKAFLNAQKLDNLSVAEHLLGMALIAPIVAVNATNPRNYNVADHFKESHFNGFKEEMKYLLKTVVCIEPPKVDPKYKRESLQ